MDAHHQCFLNSVINEVVALNRSTLYDEDAESSDWIEIFNPNKDSINLEGYYLTDDQSDLKSGGFRILFWYLVNM